MQKVGSENVLFKPELETTRRCKSSGILSCIAGYSWADRPWRQGAMTLRSRDLIYTQIQHNLNLNFTNTTVKLLCFSSTGDDSSEGQDYWKGN